MDKNISDLLRLTIANMAELLNRVADHIEELQHKIVQLEEQARKEDDDKISRR